MARKAKAKAPVSAAALYATPALEKGLDILELLSRERDGLSKSEIARTLGRTVSEIFRMLVTLERRGYIAVTENDRHVLSLRLFQLVQEHPPTERILSEALPRMHTLAEKVQQSVHLGVMDGARVVILAQANAPGTSGFYVKQGASVDLMEAATGQAILAFLPKEIADRVLREWQMESTRAVPGDLAKTLERIRKRGYELRGSYQVKGITNISYPVLDSNQRAVAALTVPHIQRLGGGPTQDEVREALAATAEELSVAIGRR